MKPFDLEAALNGAPVVTREGKPVTQLVKFDAPKSLQTTYGVLDGYMTAWFDDGSFYSSGVDPSKDLVMAPVKREGWVNIYTEHEMWSYIHHTKAEADEAASPRRVACVRIEWEE